MLITALGAGLIMLAAGHSARASMDISDIPLDTLEQAAPGIIMFVIDDSGSMDWSMMCPPADESDGVFNGYNYIFTDAGDDAYSAGSSNGERLEDSATNRMMWKSQWAGYNGMYYDPATTYTPWPGRDNADPDNPRSNPMNSSPTFDLTAMWHEWDSGAGVIVDNSDASGFTATGGWGSSYDGQQYGADYLYTNNGNQTYTATWTADGLDTSKTYNVYARWSGGGSSRLTSVDYITYDDTAQVADTAVNQQLNHGDWMQIASSVTFSSGTGVVKIQEATGTSGMCADAVKFVLTDNPIHDVARRHYFVHNDNGTYLVNLLNGAIEYYQVNLQNFSNNHERVTADELVRLTDAQAQTAGIVTGRTYDEEVQNFANWYSFYRRRIFTAKNAISNVISTMDGVYIGLIFINNYRTPGDTAAVPVRVNLDGTFQDDSATLLSTLYGYNISSYGTPLRNGLKKAGRYFQGDYMKPSTFSDQTSSETYPYFKADKGGSCQQAFTIVFTDGYYNGSSPSVGNADGDGNTNFDGDPFGDTQSDTLADVAMYYFENDLNNHLANNVPITTEDPADQQHMVTYTLAFGVSGSLDTNLYKDCPLGTCPDSWPSASSDTGKIDDMFHAAVNGRGEFLAANNSSQLNAALMALQKNIASRLGSAAALATNSIQRTVGSVIYQGTYNTANWYGEVRALPLNVTTGVVGDPMWQASDHIPAWQDRTILSYTGSAGILFKDAASLSSSQTTQLTASGLGTAQQIVDFIRGDTSNSVSNSGTLRNRSHPLGDVVHSAPTYFDGVVYVGANDGMLHAFEAKDTDNYGKELFAYVPNLVYDHLADLADAGYSHEYYVDNTATVANVGSQDVLVGGLGKGGKGYFALDVTNPKAMVASDVLWEFPSSTTDAADIADMGYSFSTAFIVHTKAAGQVVIFGNGYDSPNGHAVLFVLDALTGAVIKKFDTGVGGDNGLSTPAVVDEDLDGNVDYVFAGDLKGNMWKIDLRNGDTNNWRFYYMNGSTPEPLITVKNTSGQVQPITEAPDVMLDCAALQQGRGLMVVFGTGKYLTTDDFTDTTTQSFYGIWDWGELWESTPGDLSTAQLKYLGTPDSNRKLSNLGDGTQLLEQTFLYSDSQWSVLTDTQPEWYDPFDATSTGKDMGWCFDMPDSGERSLRDPMIRKGNVVLISTIPSNSPCDVGGSSVIYQVNACSGGQTYNPEFDTNNDGVIDSNDVVEITTGVKKPPSGKKVGKIIFTPTEIADKLYLPDSTGDIGSLTINQNRPGMFFWRVLDQ